MSEKNKKLTTEEHKQAMRQQVINKHEGRSKKETIIFVVSVIIALYAGFYGGIGYQRHKDAHAVEAAKSARRQNNR